MIKKLFDRRMLGALLSIIMLSNTIFTFCVFGATGFNFEWEKENTLTDTLVLENKVSTEDNNVFLWWDFGVKNGLKFDKGKYNLSYNIADNKRVDFVVDKDISKANITYNVWDYEKNAYINWKDAAFRVYKTTESKFVEPKYSDFPPITDDYRINYALDGSPTGFSITPNTGFSIKYDNKSIKFKWVEGTTNDVFYFETNGIEQGNVYDFNLDLTVSNTKITEKLQIFNGINGNSLDSTPYANNRKYIIDHSARPFPDAEDPGFEPEIEISFDLPKVWDETTHKYATVDIADLSSQDKTTVTLNLGNNYNERRIQIKIDNLFANDINAVTTIATLGDYTVKSERKNGKVYINIKNLEPGLIFNPTELTLYKPDKPEFLATVSTIEQGKVYTYPEFTVIANDIDEFYLRVKPFEGYKGYYTIYQGDSSATLKKWIDYEDKKGDGEYIYIPIDLYSYATAGTELPEKFFRVDFSLTAPTGITGMDHSMQSQVLRHKPSTDDIVIGAPENLTINDVYVIESVNNDQKEVVMTYSWDLAYRETLAAIAARNGGTLELYYDFKESLIPNKEDTMKKFARVKVVIKSADGKAFDMSIEEVDGEIVESSYSTKEVIKGDNEKFNTVVAKVTFKFPTARVDDEIKQEVFLYPNTYFVNVNAEYKDGEKTVTTDASTPQTKVTLEDIVDISVSAPQGFEVVGDKITNVGFDLKWDTLKYKNVDSPLYQYYQGMVVAKGLDFEEKSIKYGMYFSQEKENLDGIIKNEKNRENLPKELSDKIKIITLDKVALEGIDFKTVKTDDNYSAIEWLRKGNIIKVQDILQDTYINEQILNVTGLDENQVYYACGETVILPYYKDDASYKEELIDYSGFTSIVTATTKPNHSSPTDEENAPSAPSVFESEEVDKSSAKLKWSNVREKPSNPESNSYLAYQFIRITGKNMDEALIDQKLEYADVWAKLPKGTDKAGFRVDSTGRVFEYINDAFNTTPSDETLFECDMTGYEFCRITDKNLIPNELYFYYVRTVRIADGKDVSYSSWVKASVTTTPVPAPTNLKLESIEDYDKLTEATISFDVPVTEEQLISGEYVVQYSVKADNKDWAEDKDINPNKLIMSKGSGSELVNCKYTIENLKSNTMYHIRVRLFHKELGAASLYSNTVQMRTDFDQEDYESDRKSQDWLDYYKDKVGDIITNPYWLVYDSFTSTTVVYRPNSFQNVIAGTTDTTILLAQGENNGSKKVYYLPSKAIEEAYTANKGFKILWNNADVVITPRSIDPSTNGAILDAKDEIRDGVFKDYFVKITANFSPVSYLVNGNTALSPVVDLQIEVVGTKRLITDWDKSLANEILEKAFKDEKLNDIVKDIKEEVGDEATNEELLAEIKDKIDDFVDDFEDKVETKINNIKSRVYTSGDLAGNVYIAYPVSANTNVLGNKNENGVWVTKDVIDYNGKKAILTKSPGTYALTGKIITIPALDGVPGSTTIINIIGKYNLDDYLGKDNALNLSGSLSRNAAIGCAARLAGAKKTDDPVAYLSGKGIQISARASAQGMPSQEVLYLVMGVYGVRTNTKIDTIKIRNYTLTANIKNIAPVYKKSVQAAFETGIYSNQNMIATSPMTVKDFLLILPNLATKAKL